jgi:hypothetical protein
MSAFAVSQQHPEEWEEPPPLPPKKSRSRSGNPPPLLPKKPPRVDPSGAGEEEATDEELAANGAFIFYNASDFLRQPPSGDASLALVVPESADAEEAGLIGFSEEQVGRRAADDGG